MAKARVYVARQLPAEAIRRIKSSCDAAVWERQGPSTRRVLLQRVKGIEGLLCTISEKVDAELLDAAAPDLRVVSNLGVGFDNIDVPELTRRGIPLGNTPGVLTETTADLAFGLIIAASRRLVEGDRRVRAGKWRFWDITGFLGEDVHDATIGIIGMGKIGTAVARRAKGFGMRVLYHDLVRRRDVEAELGAVFSSLEGLLSEADFVTIHADLNQGTLHLIDAERIRLMKRNSILVNTARGTIVDNMALFKALKARRIRGAALDVTDPEPLPRDHPLLGLDNVLVTPHIGSASVATRSKMAELAVNNLLAGLEGKRLPHCVNPEVYVRNRLS